MKVGLGIFSPTLLQVVRLMMVMMIARVMSWGLVVHLNHGAGALWVGLNIIFALTLLLSLQGCQSLTSPFSFLRVLFLLDYFLDWTGLFFLLGLVSSRGISPFRIALAYSDLGRLGLKYCKILLLSVFTVDLVLNVGLGLVITSSMV